MDKSISLRDAEGRKVVTTLAEMSDKALYRSALKGEKGARAYLFDLYHREQLAALERPVRRRVSAEQKALAAQLAVVIDTQYSELTALLDRLEQAGLVYRVAGKRFVAPWAVDAATQATRLRLAQRRSE